METASTKDRAVEAALTLFSGRGYQGTSMGDIATALGIKAPSLYKHFPGGKEELYAALFPRLDEHYRRLWSETARRQEQLERDLASLGALSAQRLEQETLTWLQGEMEDPQGERLRRLMARGQFEDAGYLDRWLWNEPVALYEGFFDRLIARDILRRGEPHVMAVQYLAPLFVLLAQQDRSPESQDACLAEARAHIRQFHRIFAHREQQRPQTGVGRLFRR